MTRPTLEELKRVAEAAVHAGGMYSKETPEFRRTFDPPTVLWLIGRLERAESALNSIANGAAMPITAARAALEGEGDAPDVQ